MIEIAFMFIVRISLLSKWPDLTDLMILFDDTMILFRDSSSIQLFVHERREGVKKQ